MKRFLPRSAGAVLLLAAPLVAQAPPPAAAPFGEKLLYLLAQANAGFSDLRGDSIGPAMWRSRFLIATNLDSATALTATSITELARQHADGRPGKTLVGVFPLELAAPGDSSGYVRYRGWIAGALPAWQPQAQAGHWAECADPRRGRELLLSSSRTASGQLLLMLTITLHPDASCG